MSSFALTALAGISSSSLDATFTLTTSETDNTTIRFGDGVYGAALPTGSCSVPQAIYEAGGGASGSAASPALQPQVGDEVSVAFEHGQMRSPFVVAPLWCSADRPPTSDGAAEATHAEHQSVSSDLDSMSEMGETESLTVALNPQPLPPKDINGLVQWVLRESYASGTEDLRFFAEKVKFYNEAKKQVRDELHSAREALGEVDSHIKGLEDKLNSAGDDAQLANVDLQNTLQQQQTLLMMSNISKQVHDTALNLIRKIGT